MTTTPKTTPPPIEPSLTQPRKPHIKLLPGLRTIKTALAVFISLLIYAFLGREGAIFAIMSIIICMQDNVEKSISEGINRTIATCVGAGFGTLFVFATLALGTLPMMVYYLLVMVGIVLLIHICHLVGIRRSIVLAAIIYMVIILGAASENPIQYSIDRTVDTLAGIVLATLVNRFMFKPKARPPKAVRIAIGKGNNCQTICLNSYHMNEDPESIIYTAKPEDTDCAHLFAQLKSLEPEVLDAQLTLADIERNR